MFDVDSILYSIAAFICALFLLEKGADEFLDNTAILAKRTGIPEGLIALLTAGAEWEELAVVLFSMIRGRESLALGNVVGSAISNILGAFSLGLLLSSTAEDSHTFDANSRRYTVLQLGITILASILLGLQQHSYLRAKGIGLFILFVVYVGSIFWAIRKGLITGPELSDSDSDRESTSDSDEEDHCASTLAQTTGAYGTFHDESRQPEQTSRSTSEARPLRSNRTALFPKVAHHSLLYHILHLLFGFLSVLISAYVLTHAAITLVDQLGLSDEVFGIVILSIATTLPEKLIATVSSLRGQTDITVANTAGSNIFLLTLCLGTVWVSDSDGSRRSTVHVTELIALVASSLAMALAVFTSGRVAKVLGLGMLLAYLVFLSLEVTFVHHSL